MGGDPDLAGIGLRDYASIFAIRSLRWPVVWSALARMPYAMLTMNVLFLVETRSSSFGVAGIASAGVLVGTAVGSMVLGRAFDLWGPTTPLTATTLIFVLATTVLLAWRVEWGTGPLALVAVLLGLSQPNVAPASRALWSRAAVDERTAAVGASYEALSLQSFFVLGPGVAGLWAVFTLEGVGLLVTCLLMSGAALAFAWTPAVSSWRGLGVGSVRSGPWLRRSHVLTQVVISACVGFLLGTAEVVVPAVAEIGGLSAGAGGLLLSGWTIGSLVFALVYGRRPWPCRLQRRPATLTLFFGVMMALTGLAAGGPFLIFAAAIVAAGMPVAAATAAQSQVLEVLIPAERVAGAFGLLLSGLMLGAATGQALAGQIVEWRGASSALLASGGVVTCVALALLLGPVRRNARHESVTT